MPLQAGLSLTNGVAPKLLSTEARMLTPGHNLIGLDEALSQLALIDAWGAELVKLHLYVGLSLDKATATLGVVRRTAERDWAFARAPNGNHPPGYQGLERAHDAGRRPAGAQDD